MEEFVDRIELLRRLDREYRRFCNRIAPLTPEQMQTPGVVGLWSTKDLIAHLIAHEQFALRELEHALHGEHLPSVDAWVDTVQSAPYNRPKEST